MTRPQATWAGSELLLVATQLVRVSILASMSDQHLVSSSMQWTHSLDDLCVLSQRMRKLATVMSACSWCDIFLAISPALFSTRTSSSRLVWKFLVSERVFSDSTSEVGVTSPSVILSSASTSRG